MIDATTHSQNQISAIEARLRLVEDRQAIHDVIVRYCRGVDRSEPNLVLAAFPRQEGVLGVRGQFDQIAVQ